RRRRQTTRGAGAAVARASLSGKGPRRLALGRRRWCGSAEGPWSFLLSPLHAVTTIYHRFDGATRGRPTAGLLPSLVHGVHEGGWQPSSPFSSSSCSPPMTRSGVAIGRS